MSDPVSLTTVSGGLHIADRVHIEKALRIKQENPWNRDKASSEDLFPQIYLKLIIDRAGVWVKALTKTVEFIALTEKLEGTETNEEDKASAELKLKEWIYVIGNSSGILKKATSQIQWNPNLNAEEMNEGVGIAFTQTT